jgi:hypothetical protein
MKMNMKSALFGMSAAASLPLLALIASPVSAAMPTANQVTAGQTSLIETVRSDCKWVDNKWTYQKGDKRLVCRPDRPTGKGWGWHREGNRSGWYHAGRKAWHNLVW